MINDLDVFKIYSAMARHSAESQRISAENVSRAAEPGYKSMEIEPFEAFLARTDLKTSDLATTDFKLQETNMPAAPNGNTVSLENEIFRSAEAAGQHNMALSVYSKSIDLLRTALGRAR